MKTAQTEYTTAAADISGLVSELQTYADKLHDISPDAIHWGHTGDLERIKAMLTAVLAVAKHQG